MAEGRLRGEWRGKAQRIPPRSSTPARSSGGSTLRPPAGLDKGPQHRIDAGLVTFALRAEPVEDIGIEADMDVALARRQAADHDRVLPALGKRTVFLVSEPFDFLLGHGFDPRPVGPALATRDHRGHLLSRIPHDTLSFRHFWPSVAKSVEWQRFVPSTPTRQTHRQAPRWKR